MKFTTGRQFGLGNRKYTLTEDFEFFGRHLPKGLTIDGSSVPKVAIMFLTAAIMLWGFLPEFVEKLIIVVMLLVGICESSGWFMKPAAVHDYRFQNANTRFGWIEANYEYWWLMILKANEYRVTNPNNDGRIKVAFHLIMGFSIALAHFLMLMLFGWVVWFGYYFKNKAKAEANEPGTNEAQTHEVEVNKVQAGETKLD